MFLIIFSVTTLYAETGIFDLPPPPRDRWQIVAVRSAADRLSGRKGGEMAQNAHGIAICESDPMTMAMAVDLGGIYLSQDGGKNWALSRKGILANGCQGVAFDPRNKEILLCVATVQGTIATSKLGDLRNRSFPSTIDGDHMPLSLFNPDVDGIYLSENGGHDWALVAKASYLVVRGQRNYFAFDPNSFDGTRCRIVYAGTHQNGLLRSTDGGKTWKTIGLVGKKIESVVLHSKNKNTIFVGALEGLFISHNGGESFESYPQLAEGPMWALEVSRINPQRIFTVWCQQTNFSYKSGKASTSLLFRSMNGGLSFESITNLPVADWRKVIISPIDDNIMYLLANSFAHNPYYSCDGGNSWNARGSAEGGFHNRGQLCWFADALAPHPFQCKTAFATLPLQITRDGGRTWSYLGDGICGSRLPFRASIAFAQEPASTYFAFIDMGLARTTDNCNTFSEVPIARFEGLRTVPIVATGSDGKALLIAIGGWDRQILRKSCDGGDTWRDIPRSEGKYRFAAYHCQQPNIIYVSKDDKGFKSDDAGETWVELGAAVLAVERDNSERIYGVRSKKDGKFEIWRSVDGGISWGSLGEVAGRVSSIDYSKNGNVYVATEKELVVFNRTGAFRPGLREGITYSQFGETQFTCVAADPGSPEIVYATTRSIACRAEGIFRSIDGGRSWSNISGSLYPLTVWMAAVNPYDGTVYIGTDNGIYRMARP